MSTLGAPNRLAVGRVQVRRSAGAAEGETAVRLRLGRLLGSASWQSSALPPATILIVRHLADPLPGRIASGPDSIRVAAAWERAAQGALAGLHRRAARPYQGPPPPDAEAVRFADEAELLACLVWDVSRGVAADRWWWRTFLPRLPSSPASAVAAILGRSAPAAPAILHHLTRRAQAVPVVALLSPAQAAAVLAAVASAYGHTDLLGIVHRPAAPFTEVPRQRAVGAGISAAPPGQAASPSQPALWPPAEAPWPPAWIPATLTGVERRCLLGVGLSLHARPTVLRSAAFLSALRDWWQAEVAAAAAGDAERGARPRPDDTGSRGEVAPDEFPGPAPPPGPRPAEPAPAIVRPPMTVVPPLPASSVPERVESEGGEGLPEPFSGREPARRTPETASRPDVPEPARVLPRPDPTRARRPPAPDIPEPAPPDVRESEGPPLQPSAAPSAERSEDVPGRDAAPRDWGSGVETELGGVLYLINLMVRLDLPACFEEGWRLASTVGGWGVLELLGRGLLTREGLPAAPEWCSDPLWAALAHLDGRVPGQSAGNECPGSEEFSLPPGWPGQVDAPLGERGAYRWGVRDGRLRLWSAAGYLLAERLRNPSTPDAQAREELRRYVPAAATPNLAHAPFDQAPVAALGGPLVAGLSPAPARWLALVLPFVRLRLRGALRAPGETAGAGEDLCQGLLLRRGKLYVTSTHVDLVMRLDDVSLPARLAGLDRDPGWLGDWGRVILFHFD